MELKQVLGTIEYEVLNGSIDGVDIVDIVYDSRKANKGTIFVCMVGAAVDGHAFAEKAYELGCRAFVVQKHLELPDDAVQVCVSDSRAALAIMSDNFFGHPSGEVKVIGITGTKGKTTTTHIIKTVLDECGIKAGLIGTVGATWGEKLVPTVNTTPESYETEKILRAMADDGVEVCAMEVSSLGVKSHRVDGIEFFCGVFTNISPDHIGGAEHKDFEEYYSWKKAFFEMCSTAIGCIDDPATEDMLSPVNGQKIYYGFSEKSNFKALNLKPTRQEKYLGVSFDLDIDGNLDKCYEISLPGDFSVQNALAAISVMTLLGVEPKDTKEALTKVSVNGRAQIVYMSKKFGVIIDYAHNGLSLESICKTIREYEPKRLIALYGSVGDRAQLRREELGRAAGKYADFSVITSDDPGFEDQMKICTEISEFLLDENPNAEFVKITDREEAVNFAVNMLRDGDILLLCGKGHETAQKICGEKVPYSEIEVATKALKSAKII